MSDVNDLINVLGDGDMSAAQNVFADVMNDKMQAAMDARKIEIAQSMYAPEEQLELDFEGNENDNVQELETEAE